MIMIPMMMPMVTVLMARLVGNCQGLCPISQSQLKQSPTQAVTQRFQLLLNDLETCTLQLHLNGPFYLIKSQDQRVKN